MYKRRTRSRRFDTSNLDDMELYSEIIGNPLCTVIGSENVTLSENEYDEGKLTHSEQRLIYVVTWEEKELL